LFLGGIELQDNTLNSELIQVQIKKCRTCNEEKPLSEYYTRKDRPGYTTLDCKQCEKVRKQKYCSPDAVEYKAHRKAYREAHKEEIKAKLAIYRELHREKAKVTTREWYRNNIEYARKRGREYAKKHTEHKNEYNHKYYIEHKEAMSAYKKEYIRKNYEKMRAVWSAYCKSPRGREVDRAKSAKRRCLGFDPINKIFENSSYHHFRFEMEKGVINNNIGVYIPTSLHNAIRHNGFTGRNMDKINKSALEWYIANTSVEELNPTALELCKHYNIAVEQTA
jgi:hypothetical protein